MAIDLSVLVGWFVGLFVIWYRFQRLYVKSLRVKYQIQVVVSVRQALLSWTVCKARPSMSGTRIAKMYVLPLHPTVPHWQRHDT
jgi:hypothetical protein